MSESRFIASRYKLEKLIGQGGMGAVYLGRDVNTGDEIAIKALKDEVMGTDPDIVERFTREADSLRKLNHPNIVKMLAMVEENGQRYLIMEYVVGGSLSDLLREQPQLPLERALEVGLDLADALTRTHRLNIVHRDIKPQNVLMAQDGTPRLTDFGVARVEDRTRMTETGMLVGTYAYLSPEACNGEEVDEKTDIWAFGVMLYQMLAGRRPFESESITALLLSIIRDPHPDIHTFRSDIPKNLSDLIDLMLVKDADQRINSIRQVGAELEAILREVRTGEARPSRLKPLDFEESRFSTPTPASSIGKKSQLGSITRWLSQQETALKSPSGTPVPVQSRRMPLGLIVVLVGLVILAGALAFSALSKDNAEPETEVISVAPVAENELMILVADFEAIDNPTTTNPTRFVIDDLTNNLETLPFSTLRIRNYPEPITKGEQVRSLADQTGATVIVWGNYSDSDIEVNINVGSIEKFHYNQFDRQLLENTLNVRVQLNNARQQSVAPQVMGMLPLLYAADGNIYENVRTLVLLGNTQLPSGEILGNTEAAFLYRFLGSFFTDEEQALAYLDQALNINQGNALLQAAPILLYWRMGDYDHVKRVTETARRLGPSNWATPLNVTANLNLLDGDLDGAIQLYDEIVRLRPDDWYSYNYRAALHYQNGDYEAAKADYAKTFELGPTADFPYTYSTLLALRDGRLKDAREYVDIVLTQYKDPTLSKRFLFALGWQEVNVFGWAFSAFGNLISAQYDDALRDLETVIAIDPDDPDYYFMQGFVYCNLGDNQAAEAAYSQAIELDPEFELLYIMRAEVRLAQDNTTEALADLGKAAELGMSDELATLVENSDTVNCKNFLTAPPEN